MGRPKSLTAAQEQDVVARYQAGLTMKELASEFGCSVKPIQNALYEQGVSMRPAHVRAGRASPRPSARLFTDAQAAELALRYQDGALIAELAAEAGVSRKAVNNALRRRGVRLRGPREASEIAALKRHERGEPPPNWKGGRTVNADGYVLAAVGPDDPMWEMAKLRRRRTSFGHSYVLEHRLVMARHLGRPLTPSETVHHKNGKRDDNRLENLQLRSGKHGKGQNLVCADCGSRNIVADDLG